MKRFLALFMSATLLFCFTACNNSKQEETDTAAKMAAVNDAINAGDYEKAYNMLLEIEGEEAEKLRSNFYFMPVTCEEDGYDITTYTYDAHGNVLTENSDYTDGHFRHITYTYDENGRIVNYKITHSDDKLCDVTFTYDDKGNYLELRNSGNYLIKLTATGGGYGGYIWDKVSYTYDSDGNLLVKDYHYPDDYQYQGKKKIKTVYTYDEQGNCILTEDIYDDNSWEKIACTYNEHGDILTRENIYPYGSSSKNTYSYDSDGTLTTLVIEASSTKRIITYDKNGNEISDETIYTNEESFGVGKWHKDTYTYSEDNKILSKLETGYDNEWEKYVVNYDEKGNPVEVVVTNYDNEEGKILYTYDEYGNFLTRTLNGTLDTKVTWKLFYFPDGVHGRAEDILYLFTHFHYAHIIWG